ncbi:MAG TPA: glycine cleavage system protein GcvH [Myxococcota bacterium]|nr:glycine cleavage system protein GcvH [Myxococcota bacterium]
MSYPRELRYSEDHEWVRVEGDVVAVGVTDHAQGQLGDIVYVELPELGEEVAAGDTVCEVESVKAVSDIIAPVSGKIVEVNEVLEDTGELMNSAPYGEGWIFKLELTDATELDGLMDAAAYQSLVEEG